MRRAAIRVCQIIFDWVSSCFFHPAATQLSARTTPAVRVASERGGTSVQFPQIASFSQALDLWSRALAAPSARPPAGGADIE
ncbi:hypothetical protein CgunFtcFv8_004709 [Champsocephalus gunnari]|uniref:Uncharacterized protein n=1 Tax=Champsocephalus gunnari TaxID=52237 RepID=A0AAN8HYF8_CHAGU|nr:hypothetical protein CgunFtcFv8_004709 [Champsocephalus gunnari]